MAKFECEGMPDLVVSTEVGFIQFRNSNYETVNKKEIEALSKAKNVKGIGAKASPKVADAVK